MGRIKNSNNNLYPMMSFVALFMLLKTWVVRQEFAHDVCKKSLIRWTNSYDILAK